MFISLEFVIMKTFFLIIASVLLARAYSQDHKDCEVSFSPSFKLKYQETFAIPEACLRVRCQGGQNFEVLPDCPRILHGAPSDYAVRIANAMGDKILKGEGCDAMSVFKTVKP